MVQLTQHGYDRAKERNNSKGDSALKDANRAYERGKDLTDFSKETRKYLANVLAASSGDTLKVWGNSVWLFGHQKLITTFPMPLSLMRKESRAKVGKRWN